MESTICLMCQTEDADWWWQLNEKDGVAICNVCYEIIQEEKRKDPARYFGTFMTLKEYNAMKELEGGCLGHRL